MTVRVGSVAERRVILFRVFKCGGDSFLRSHESDKYVQATVLATRYPKLPTRNVSSFFHFQEKLSLFPFRCAETTCATDRCALESWSMRLPGCSLCCPANTCTAAITTWSRSPASMVPVMLRSSSATPLPRRFAASDAAAPAYVATAAGGRRGGTGSEAGAWKEAMTRLRRALCCAFTDAEAAAGGALQPLLLSGHEAPELARQERGNLPNSSHV